MKYTPLLVVVFCFATKYIHAQDPSKAKTSVIEMKQYFFVMLINGTNRNQDSISTAKIQDGHMANITRLYNIGKIIVAGPFDEQGEWREIFIFDCKTDLKVEGYLKTDPAIIAGRLNYEILGGRQRIVCFINLKNTAKKILNIYHYNV